MTPAEEQGWTQYAKLVLNELHRHNEQLDRFERYLGEIQSRQSILERELRMYREDVVQARADLVILNRTLDAASAKDLIGQAVERYKRYIIGLMLVILTSVVIPLVRLFYLGA